MNVLKTSRRQFLAASGMVGLQSVLGRWPATAQSATATLSRRFSFGNGSAGMLPCFTDYALSTTGFDFLAEVRPLPPKVQVPGRNRNAFYIQGDNHSDDLFMFLKAALTSADGIVANQAYLLSFDLWFASKSNNCVGVGGGEDSVFLKAGGSTVEPVPLLQSDNYVSINVDKGDQSQGGQNLGVVGNIWNGKECPISEWVMLHKTYSHPYPIQASDAELWIAVGTESGFEALTGVYYYSIGVRLTPVSG
jgi:hypothetical protein